MKSITIWLTGRPCSGKTTISNRLKAAMKKKGIDPICIDGDDIRLGLNKNLGYSEEDRSENLRRAAHVAKLINDNSHIVIASFVSPTNKLRKMVKEIIGNMAIVYVKCSLDGCIRRDSKGMYKKAMNNEIKDFTGISAPFEEPEYDLMVDTEKSGADECAREIIDRLGL